MSLVNLFGPVLDSLGFGAAYQSRIVFEALAVEGARNDLGLTEQSGTVTYRRYDTGFEAETLADLGLADAPALRVTKGRQNELLDQFVAVGRAAAARHVEAKHFPAGFDVHVPVEASKAAT